MDGTEQLTELRMRTNRITLVFERRIEARLTLSSTKSCTSPKIRREMWARIAERFVTSVPLVFNH
jgi:hypothetical protein